MHTVCVCVSEEAREGVRTIGIGVPGSCELPYVSAGN